jgi:RNA polymerase sigma-70 factor, ECF subfamily
MTTKNKRRAPQKKSFPTAKILHSDGLLFAYREVSRQSDTEASARMSMEATQFRTLVETHQKMVFSIALRVTGEYGAAEEVAQDVFLELYRGAERLTSADHVRFWLRRVTVHRATDALRRKSRQPEAAAEEWMEEQHVENENTRLDAGIEARLEELLRALPESMRVAVVLRYQEEMAPDEIAKLLGQPVATVKSHLQRGLQLLRVKAAVTMKGYVRGQV